MRLEADSKFGYYPCSIEQIAEIKSYFKFYTDYYIDYPDIDLHNELKSRGLTREEVYATYHAGDLEELNKANFYTLSDCTVIDPFAGCGEILSHFGKTKVAVEIDKSRFDTIKANYKFNSAFEDLELPKNCFDICIFNPPYGDTNGVRNVRHYLQVLLDKEIMPRNSYTIMIVPENDMYDSLDLIWQNFHIESCVHLKNSKFKQVVAFCKRKITSDISNPAVATKYLEFKSEFKVTNFNTDNISSIYITSYRANIAKLMAKMNSKKFRKPASTYDKVWKWAIDDTNAKLGDVEIVLAKPPTLGALSNILASGCVNGRIEGEAPHIVAGGVKKTTKRQVEDIEINGKMTKRTIETRSSQPYISILTKIDNKIVIKEIE